MCGYPPAPRRAIRTFTSMSAGGRREEWPKDCPPSPSPSGLRSVHPKNRELQSEESSLSSSLLVSDASISMRIFRDSRIVPNVVSEVIYPRSTGVSVKPCGSQNLACSFYGKLRYVRSSSAFPTIGQFVVDRETATNTTTAMITGAGSTVCLG